MNILMFCSNPVNGGTARIFYELVTATKCMTKFSDKVTACVNVNNSVDIYKKIDKLERLPIYSEEEICSGMYGGTKIKRIVNRFRRKIKYWNVKKHNIAIMREYLDKNRIDAVLIHNGGYIGDDLCNQMLTASYHCARHTLCRIYILHNDMEKSLFSKIRFWLYDRKISKEATEIVTVSQFTKNRLCQSSFIRRDIKVIYNGISDAHTLTEEEKQEIIYLDSQKINILMIGNFLENKGQHKFLEAAKQLEKNKEIYHFTIIGNIYDENYFRKCENLIKEFELSQRISIYHSIYNASDFINLFDILVVPSMYDESFGLISVEAMENRRPVVAFACGGVPEVIIDGRDGFVVPVGDAKLMAEKIEWLAMHPNERKIMGEYCRKDYVERFSVETMTKRYLELIEGYSILS